MPGAQMVADLVCQERQVRGSQMVDSAWAEGHCGLCSGSSNKRRSFICLLSEKQNCARTRAWEVTHPRSLATFYLIELMFSLNPGNAYTCIVWHLLFWNKCKQDGFISASNFLINYRNPFLQGFSIERNDLTIMWGIDLGSLERTCFLWGIRKFYKQYCCVLQGKWYWRTQQ